MIEARIRERAKELGFTSISFSAAGPARRSDAFHRWLARGFAGDLGYMTENPASRADVTLRSPWARTVISAAYPYGTPAGRPGFVHGPPGIRAGSMDPSSSSPSRSLLPPADTYGGSDCAASASAASEQPGISGLVSRYAVGEDYHDVVKRRLQELARFIRQEAGGRVETRTMVDTSAVLERDHASSGGLGGTGKNALVIDPDAGSYVFLGEILTDLELDPGRELDDPCGGCTRCLEACPTQAIVEPRVVDARRCISYLTIELQGSVPSDMRASLGEHLFGCDVCQEVCPWNRTAREAVDPALAPGAAVEGLGLADAVRLDEATFHARFRRSPISRAKRRGFVRSALIVAANRHDDEALAAGRPLLEDADPVVRNAAVWALARGEHEERRQAERAAGREPDAELRRRMLDDLDL